MPVAFQPASRLSASASRLPGATLHTITYRRLAQAMIRWHLQEGRSAIPKSVRPEQITENFDVFDSELTTEELKVLDSLDTCVRGGPEPRHSTCLSTGT